MDMFAALADPTRRTIIEMLSDNGQLSASDIYNHFNVSHPAISQHLKILRESKLVDMEKRAQQRLYQVNPEAVSEIEFWIAKVKKQWNNRFDILNKVIKEGVGK
ncbi:MAG TPA: metalloregulator ArsR/SmtB family transcription factor [Patescibacteria group bacterium]